jgi:hypothetical protein
MKFGGAAFNIYLLCVLALAGGGCATSKKAKDLSTIRFHIETNPDGTERNALAMVGRKDPFPVNIEKKPFLTEAQVQHAAVVDALGGYQIMIQFDRQGTWLLEQYSTAAKEKRVAISSAFPEARWLAAPRLARRITDGLFVFTPDATREEAERIVKGLNLMVEEIAKGNRM